MELIATEAREIDKSKVTEPEITMLNGKAIHGAVEDTVMKAGDFYVDRHQEDVTIAVKPPASFLKRIIWRRFGEKEKTHLKISYRVILSCPCCGLPILLNPAYVEQTRPLTIAKPVGCPYAPSQFPNSHAFEVKDGNITLALNA